MADQGNNIETNTAAAGGAQVGGPLGGASTLSKRKANQKMITSEPSSSTKLIDFSTVNINDLIR